jgi:hypothetical protein
MFGIDTAIVEGIKAAIGQANAFMKLEGFEESATKDIHGVQVRLDHVFKCCEEMNAKGIKVSQGFFSAIQKARDVCIDLENVRAIWVPSNKVDALRYATRDVTPTCVLLLLIGQLNLLISQHTHLQTCKMGYGMEAMMEQMAKRTLLKQTLLQCVPLRNVHGSS